MIIAMMLAICALIAYIAFVSKEYENEIAGLKQKVKEQEEKLCGQPYCCKYYKENEIE